MKAVAVTLLLILAACSSGPEVKKQAYAKLPNKKTFEAEPATVWKAIEEALREYKLEEKKESEGHVRTEWIYSTSNDKYIEYKVNGFPKKKYIGVRYKFDIQTEKVMGGTTVEVKVEEDDEKLKSDGTSDGWMKAKNEDSMHQNEMLRNIELKILSHTR